MAKKTAKKVKSSSAAVASFQTAKLQELDQALELVERVLVNTTTLLDTLDPDAQATVYKRLKAMEKALESPLEDVKDRLLVETLKHGDEDGRVLLTHWALKRVEQAPRKTIVRELLIAQGVTPKKIAAATKVGEPTSYALVTPRKNPEPGADA